MVGNGGCHVEGWESMFLSGCETILVMLVMLVMLGMKVG